MPIMHDRVYTGLTGRASPTEILFLWWLPRRALVYPEQEMNVVVALATIFHLDVYPHNNRPAYFYAMMATSTRWLGLLGAAAIASSVSVSAYSSSSTGCYELWVGDGFCDNRNNNAECGEYLGRLEPSDLGTFYYLSIDRCFSSVKKNTWAWFDGQEQELRAPQ